MSEPWRVVALGEVGAGKSALVLPETSQQRADREALDRLNEPQNLHNLAINSGYQAMVATAKRWMRHG